MQALHLEPFAARQRGHRGPSLRPFSCVCAVDPNYNVTTDSRHAGSSERSPAPSWSASTRTADRPEAPYAVDVDLVEHVAAFVAAPDMRLDRCRDFAAQD